MDALVSDSDTVLIESKRLLEFVFDVLKALGASRQDARISAEVMVEGDLRGYPAHGVMRLKQIVMGVKAGTYRLNAKPILEGEHASIALLNGNFTLGYSMACQAMEIAIKKAQSTGIGAMGVHNSTHFGIAGYYANMAAEREMIGISMCTTEPCVAPPGGKRKVLGTNPISFAIPTGLPYPILVDMATSVFSRGKVIQALINNKKLQPYGACDKHGLLTTNPLEALEGFLLPFGGIKGYCLSLLIQILAGPLVNAAVGTEVKGTRDSSFLCTKGDFMMAIDIEKFVPILEFKREVQKFIRQVEKSCLSTSVRIPGKRSFYEKRRRLRKGIPISTHTLEELKDIGNSYNINI